MEYLMTYLLAEDVGVLEQKFRITRKLVDSIHGQVLRLSQAGLFVQKNDQIYKREFVSMLGSGPESFLGFLKFPRFQIQVTKIKLAVGECWSVIKE